MFIVSCATFAADVVLSVKEALHLAEVNSPRLSASRFRELASKKSVDIAKANYYPILTAQATDDTGFKGSARWLQVEGLMGSPFRSGFSAGLVAKQIVWDFGRTYYAVEASKHEVAFRKQDLRVTDYQVKQLTLQTFYECSMFKTQRKRFLILRIEHVINNDPQYPLALY